MKNLMKKAFIEGYKQRAESGSYIFDDISRLYAVKLFNKWYKKQCDINGVSVSLPDAEKLFELAHYYAYKRCSLQNFESEPEIEIHKLRYVHGYEQAIKDFVDNDYDPDKLCNER